MYINRMRPHDADVKRRNYALQRAQKLEALRRQFIDWALREGKNSEEIKEGIEQIEMLVETWKDVADQHTID